MRDFKKMESADLGGLQTGICFFLFLLMFIVVFSGLAYLIYS